MSRSVLFAWFVIALASWIPGWLGLRKSRGSKKVVTAAKVSWWTLMSFPIAFTFAPTIIVGHTIVSPAPATLYLLAWLEAAFTDRMCDWSDTNFWYSLKLFAMVWLLAFVAVGSAQIVWQCVRRKTTGTASGEKETNHRK